MHDYSAQLGKYMPEPAARVISRWINDSGCLFRISKGRTSKFGDYRPPYNGQGHRISVNHNLNPYAFLITTVHEFAHLATWNAHQNRTKPHGKEWKANFKRLMKPFLEARIFPSDIEVALIKHMENPAASSCTDRHLFLTLRRYDHRTEYADTVEALPPYAIFTLKNGRMFQKKEKVRKRYRCIEIKTKRIYLFSPFAEVIHIKTSI